jgi:hypothetical protein
MPAALFLFLPLVFLAAYAVAWKLGGSARRSAREGVLSSAASHGSPDDVPGFAGVLVLETGRLTALLLPLQVVPEWQAFDAQALLRRLGHAGGEPWRLELSYVDDKGVAGELSLAQLEVRDGAGVALKPDRAGEPDPDPRLPSDPLRVLFLGTPARLAPNTHAQVCCFGRTPKERLELVVGEPFGPASEALVLDLAPVRIPSAEVARHLARIERTRETEQAR